MLLLSCSLGILAQQTVTVGVIGDGPTPGLASIRASFQKELLDLTEGEFDIRFNEDHVVSGQWNRIEIEKSLETLLTDDEIDVILSLGFVSSLIASRTDPLAKPTFAPLVLDSNLLNLPRQGDASGIENLNYLSEEVRFIDDLKSFREVANFTHLALLVDAAIFESVPELAERGIQWAKQLNIHLQYIQNTSKSENLIEKIPPETEAVMLAALPRLNQQRQQALIDGINQRNLPSYSLAGTTPVRNGVLAATSPDSDWQRRARKNALNMQAVLLGEAAGRQPVSFRHKRQLTINMKTARQLRISPRFDVLSSAVLLHQDTPATDVRWSLSSVAQQALKANLNIQSSRAGVDATAEQLVQAKAQKRPQLYLSGTVNQRNGAGPSVRHGLAAEQTAQLDLSVSQLLYSDKTNTAIAIRQLEQQGAGVVHHMTELDSVLQALVGFLNVLKTQTILDIRKTTLNLSRTNLGLAQDRVQLGSASTSDIYRWQSEVATSRRDLLLARSQLQQSMSRLNLHLNRPIDEKFQTTPASLENPSLLVSRQELIEIIDNQQHFDLMGEFFIQQGLRH